MAFVSSSFLLDFSVPGFVFGFGVGVFFDSGSFVDSGDSSASVVSLLLGFGVGSSSSSLDFVGSDFVLLFGVGDSSASGVGLFLGRGVGVAFGGFFLDLALRFAGFGFAVGSGVSAGAGEATARISSRAFVAGIALLFFFVGQLRVDEGGDDRAEGEGRAKKNAKTDHGRRA